LTELIRVIELIKLKKDVRSSRLLNKVDTEEKKEVEM
jgi:hypothetical protein